MENTNENSIFNFNNVDEEAKSNLSGIAQWTNINAIVGFVSAGLSLITTVVGLGRLGSFGSSSNAVGAILGLIITLAISLLLNITLIAAAQNIKKGIEQTDQGHFALGLNKLATYFKILGIITIVVIALLLLVILAAGLLGGRGTY